MNLSVFQLEKIVQVPQSLASQTSGTISIYSGIYSVLGSQK